MKRAIYGVSLFLNFVYLCLFCSNAQLLASKHMDLELFYPCMVILLSVIALIVTLIIRKVKQKGGKNYYIIPLMFLICGCITLFIGYNTPCCIGG